MISERKLKIARAITDVLCWNYSLPTEQIELRLKINPFNPTQGVYCFRIDKHLGLVSHKTLRALKEELNAVDVYTKNIFKTPHIHVEISPKDFISDALRKKDFSKPLLQEKQKIVVDFSSPNIAKPFHMGHLRSTVIGNFIANINQFIGNQVVRLNYVGDWGVQFGLLKVGLEEGGYREEDVAKNPIKVMLEAYVKANSMAEESGEVIERAKGIFRDLELAQDDSPDLNEWKLLRKYTLKELQRVYKRIGIEFDEYNWESDYSAQRIQPLINRLKEQKIVREEDDGALVSSVYDQTLPILKRDGTTLYLTRDIAAAIDRFERFKFDKMYYVVDTMQRGHFISLQEIMKKLDPDLAEKLIHLPFGRVTGVSTRKGKAVWLDDILDELYQQLEQKQLDSPYTKVPVGGEITDTLALSCLISFDLKQKRSTHYAFDMNTISQMEGFTGAKFQYCHCRLCSLEENCGASLPVECNPEMLLETEAMRLVNIITRFSENVLESHRHNESCILVNYLFELCEEINRAFTKLKVKGQDPELASQRLLLFTRAKEILSAGMRIIGIKPLTKM